jgi:hypothetical protein
MDFYFYFFVLRKFIQGLWVVTSGRGLMGIGVVPKLKPMPDLISL